MSIKPLCIEDRSYYLELNGMFLPCCHIATCTQSIERLKEIYGSDYSKLFIKNNTHENIIEMWDKIAETWTTENPLKICRFICSESNWKDVMKP